jgi:hypothetical protein
MAQLDSGLGAMQGPWRVASVRDGVRRLFEKAPAPPGWPVGLAVLLAFAAGMIAFMLLDGVRRGEVQFHFAEHKLGTWFSVALLFTAAGLSTLVQWRLRDLRYERFWAWSAIGFVFLAFDDWFRLHERMDVMINTAVGLDPEGRYADHLDDVLVALWGLLFLGLFVIYRRHVLTFRAMVWCLVAAAGCLVCMIGIDLMKMPDKTLEELAKVVGGVWIVAGYLAALMHPAVRSHRAGPYRSRLDADTRSMARG